MRDTREYTDANRYGNLYKVYADVLTIPTSEVTVGDRIYEGSAWSSHGMKDGFWSEAITADDDMADLLDYYGDEVVVSRVTKRIQVG